MGSQWYGQRQDPCHRNKLVVEGIHSGLTLGIGHETSGEGVHGEALGGCILGIDLSLILDETAVGRHIREEDERQTTGEETGTAANLQALVSEDVPGETDTGRQGHVGSWPFAGVDVGLLVVMSLGIIGEKRYRGFCIQKSTRPDFKKYIEESRYKEETTTRFQAMVYSALAQQLISTSKAATLLGVSINNIRKNATTL